METINSENFIIEDSDYQYSYQQELTGKLDNLKSDFNQDILNEIVLWKVNRYAEFDSETIELLNSIRMEEEQLDANKTREVLNKLLRTKGVKLAMASTILRFKNPNVYQIIDQRVFRILYGKGFKVSYYPSVENIDSQIDLYLNYLNDLRNACEQLNIPFYKADRILYEADKRVNKEHRIRY